MYLEGPTARLFRFARDSPLTIGCEPQLYTYLIQYHKTHDKSCKHRLHHKAQLKRARIGQHMVGMIIRVASYAPLHLSGKIKTSSPDCVLTFAHACRGKRGRRRGRGGERGRERGGYGYARNVISAFLAQLLWSKHQLGADGK